MSDITPDWPAITDDDGSGRAGTPVNNTQIWDPIKTAINNQVLSGDNPALTPAQVIDEVVVARGNKADLDTRISGLIDADGAFIPPANVVSESQGESLVKGNLIPNGDFLLWPAGVSNVAPSYWVSTPAAGELSKADPPNQPLSAGNFYVKIPAASTLTLLEHEILSAAEFAGLAANLRGKKLAFAAHSVAGDDNTIALEIYDGVDTTQLVGTGGVSEWLSGLHTINDAATGLWLRIRVLQVPASDNHIGAVIAAFSQVKIEYFTPCPMQAGAIHFAGTAAVAANVARFLPGAPGIITGILVHGGVSNPDVLEADVLTWDEAMNSSESVFSDGGVLLDSTSPVAFKAPNGDYFRRCFAPVVVGGGGNNGYIVSMDVVQDGGGIDFTAEIRTRQYLRLLEAYKTVSA